jgi:hypothetical protein
MDSNGRWTLDVDRERNTSAEDVCRKIIVPLVSESKQHTHLPHDFARCSHTVYVVA